MIHHLEKNKWFGILLFNDSIRVHHYIDEDDMDYWAGKTNAKECTGVIFAQSEYIAYLKAKEKLGYLMK